MLATTSSLFIHIFRLGTDNDFKVDWRLSHRRSVNLVVVVMLVFVFAVASDYVDVVAT